MLENKREELSFLNSSVDDINKKLQELVKLKDESQIINGKIKILDGQLTVLLVENFVAANSLGEAIGAPVVGIVSQIKKGDLKGIMVHGQWWILKSSLDGTF